MSDELELTQAIMEASEEQIKQFIEMILSGEERPVPCAECHSRLPEYLAATSEEIVASEYLQVVANHLKVCQKCRQLADEIREMVQVAFGEE